MDQGKRLLIAKDNFMEASEALEKATEDGVKPALLRECEENKQRMLTLLRKLPGVQVCLE